MAITVTECNIYPVKSMRGIASSSAALTQRGLKNDRRYMLVDETGRFITQRTHPNMSTIATTLDENGLYFSTPDENQLLLTDKDLTTKCIQTSVWDDTFEAQLAANHINNWFSNYLSVPVRLVYMPEDLIRQTDPDYSNPGDHVSFADGFPILIATQPSLATLARQFTASVTMNRFRPNIVLTGNEPFAEDIWHRVKIGNVELELSKPCSRCGVTTIDQQTGDRPSKEPLTTLADLRKGIKGIYFGTYAIARTLGVISVGDTVEILSTKPVDPKLQPTRINGLTLSL